MKSKLNFGMAIILGAGIAGFCGCTKSADTLAARAFLCGCAVSWQEVSSPETKDQFVLRMAEKALSTSPNDSTTPIWVEAIRLAKEDQAEKNHAQETFKLIPSTVGIDSALPEDGSITISNCDYTVVVDMRTDSWRTNGYNTTVVIQRDGSTMVIGDPVKVIISGRDYLITKQEPIDDFRGKVSELEEMTVRFHTNRAAHR